MDSAPPPHGEPFSLLETMRLEQGRVERLERHMARMARGSSLLQIRVERDGGARDALKAVAA